MVKTVMTFSQFKESLLQDSPPPLDVLLLSLWHDEKGNWAQAHDLVNNLDGKDAARVHAYLHRKEGDESNASYWYHRAKATKPSYSLAQEWGEIVKTLLSNT